MKPDLTPVARLVFDCLKVLEADQGLHDDLIMDGIQPSWVVSGLWKCLSDAGVPVKTVYVATCNYPLAKYYQNRNLPNVNYRSTLFLQADGWLFDAGDGWGFVAFSDEPSVFARERRRWGNDQVVWHQQIEPTINAPYVQAPTCERIRMLIAAPLAAYQQQALEQQTPAVAAPRPGPRL